MKFWDYSGLKNYILSKINGGRELVLTVKEAEDIAKKFNSNYSGYKSDEHLIGNVSGAMREALVDTDVRVRCDYKNFQIKVFRANEHNLPERTEAKEHVEIIPVRATDYLIPYVPKYIEQDKELKILDAHMNMENPVPLLFLGPKGIGKTLSIAYYAYINDIPIIQYDCSENTKYYDLIGRFSLKGDKLVYKLGVVPTAIEIANQFDKAILVFEEINCLPNNMQKLLNQILDWRKHVYIEELGKIYRCKPGAKLLICATMNPSFYLGTFEINEDLRSRFAEVHIGYPSKYKEIEILEEITELPDEILKLIVTLANETRKSVEANELSYAISTRDIVLFSELYNSYKESLGSSEEALEYALKLTVLNRYDDSLEIDLVKTRIRSVFGIEL